MSGYERAINWNTSGKKVTEVRQAERIATLEQQNAELVAALELCKKHMAGDKWDSLFIDGALSKVKQP